MKKENTFKINSRYKQEILIPVAAIGNNFRFLYLKDGADRYVITTDNKIAKIKKRKTINILSEEGISLMRIIYKVTDIGQFLLKWYRQVDGKIYSLEFQYLILDSPEELKDDINE